VTTATALPVEADELVHIEVPEGDWVPPDQRDWGYAVETLRRPSRRGMEWLAEHGWNTGEARRIAKLGQRHGFNSPLLDRLIPSFLADRKHARTAPVFARALDGLGRLAVRFAAVLAQRALGGSATLPEGRRLPSLRPRTTPNAPNAPPIVLPALQAAGVAHRVETCPMT